MPWGRSREGWLGGEGPGPDHGVIPGNIRFQTPVPTSILGTLLQPPLHHPHSACYLSSPPIHLLLPAVHLTLHPEIHSLPTGFADPLPTLFTNPICCTPPCPHGSPSPAAQLPLLSSPFLITRPMSSSHIPASSEGVDPTLGPRSFLVQLLLADFQPAVALSTLME